MKNINKNKTEFNSIYFEDCQGYAHYDECYRKTKKLVDSQIETE